MLRRCALIVSAVVAGAFADSRGAEEPPVEAAAPEKPLRKLDVPGEEYLTPRAGEGFETTVLGREVRVEPRDRRTITAWDLGLSAIAPGVPTQEVLPFGSLFFWRQPDERTFFRAVLLGFYDDIIFAKSAESTSPIEAVFTFENLTLPVARNEYIDGKGFEDEQLLWGQVRGGVGIGYRERLPQPGYNDNMLAVSLLAEPGYLYFDDGKDAAPGFVEPQDTFEGRLHLKLRLDALERNLVELPHRGFALGSDLTYGYRTNWEDWGINRERDASSTKDFQSLSGYLVGVRGVPFVESERHRLIGTLHGGWGDGQDRFSNFRTGGGPTGYEFESISRPVLPGAMIEEYRTDRYAVAIGEYRYEPIFFAYVSLRSSVSYVRRERLHGGVREWSDDVLGSVGARLVSGFFFETLLQLDYNYNAGVLRRGEFGGHEVTVHVSGSF
jgi:hypothetical protein